MLIPIAVGVALFLLLQNISFFGALGAGFISGILSGGFVRGTVVGLAVGLVGTIFIIGSMPNLTPLIDKAIGLQSVTGGVVGNPENVKGFLSADYFFSSLGTVFSMGAVTLATIGGFVGGLLSR